MSDRARFSSIFGIKFLAEGYSCAKRMLDDGAFMVVPAAPALANIHRDSSYYEALLNSDFGLPDSGLMVLLMKYLKGIPVKKLSGLNFLRHFLSEAILKEEQCLFLVDPDVHQMRLNHRFLLSLDIKITLSDHYVAPIYKRKIVEDIHLLSILEKKKPRYILINLGGGVQEKLGLYLKKNLSYRPGIICTGAAIAFLTGNQVAIPPLFDALHLGWLLRCLHDPKRFIPRYIKGLALIPLILKEVNR